MARHWKEPFDPARHVEHWTHHIGGLPVRAPPDALIQKWVYFVAVCGFIFEFQSLCQLELCLGFFSEKIHPSSRELGITLEHYWQRWYERLPLWLSEEPKRKKVVKALHEALDAFNADEARR